MAAHEWTVERHVTDQPPGVVSLDHPEECPGRAVGTEIVMKTSPTGVAGGLPIGPGYRVPALIISPWTVGGWVASQTFDHTSVLRFLERITGVSEPDISQWRRRTCGDLTSTLRMSQERRPMPDLPGTGAAYSLARYEVANLPMPTVPAHQEVPHQEHGHRPRV